VTVTIDVDKNPTADAGEDVAQCEDEDFVLGGNPTGTPPVDDPSAQLGYIWSPAGDLNDPTVANPIANIAEPGVYDFEVIVFSLDSGCSDTSSVSITIEEKAKVGDFVWMDTNYNGIQDANEPGINGVDVNLLDANDNIVATTTTATIDGIAGSYEFHVCKGQYRIDVDEDDVDNKDNDPTRDAGFAGVIDLELVKEVSDPTPNVGDVVDFTVTLTNNGPLRSIMARQLH